MGKPERLASKDNPLIKSFRKVAGAPRHGRKEGLFLLEGRHLLKEALKTGWPLESVILEESLWPSWENLLLALEARVALVPSAVARGIGTQPAPEGVFALGVRKEAPMPEAEPRGRYLYLDCVQDPANAGVLVRSAAAFGFGAAFIGPGSADPFGLAALARSAGAAFHLPLPACSESGLLSWAEKWRATIVAAEEGAPPLGAAPNGPAVLVVGNEGHGLGPALRSASTLAGIPMAEGWDSLNVAAAGSILMRDLSGL